MLPHVLYPLVGEVCTFSLWSADAHPKTWLTGGIASTWATRLSCPGWNSNAAMTVIPRNKGQEGALEQSRESMWAKQCWIGDSFELSAGRINHRRKCYEVVWRCLFNTLTGSGPPLIKAPCSSADGLRLDWRSVFCPEIIQTIGDAKAS